MDDHDLKELEDPATWSDDEGYILPPARNPGAVVSVRFSLDEFVRLGQRASDQGLKVTDFIRNAALDRVKAEDPDLASSPVRRRA